MPHYTCQTQNGQQTEYGVHTKTRTKQQQWSLQSKRSHAKRGKFIWWFWPTAQKWHNKSFAILRDCYSFLPQRKQYGKPLLLVDLKNIIILVWDETIIKYHSVGCFVRPSPTPGRRAIFWNLDCSHACHCLRTADQKKRPRKFCYQMRLHITKTGPCLSFQTYRLSTWTLSSNWTNMVDMCLVFS